MEWVVVASVVAGVVLWHGRRETLRKEAAPGRVTIAALKAEGV